MTSYIHLIYPNDRGAYSAPQKEAIMPYTSTVGVFALQPIVLACVVIAAVTLFVISTLLHMGVVQIRNNIASPLTALGVIKPRTTFKLYIAAHAVSILGTIATLVATISWCTSDAGQDFGIAFVGIISAAAVFVAATSPVAIGDLYRQGEVK